MTEKIVVFTTTGSNDQAQEIATVLVEEKLAACVSIIPSILSIYLWKGKICRDAENLLLIKTSSHLFERLRKKLRQIHQYELPEIIALPVKAGDPDYLKWIEGSVLERSSVKKSSKKT